MDETYFWYSEKENKGIEGLKPRKRGDQIFRQLFCLVSNPRRLPSSKQQSHY